MIPPPPRSTLFPYTTLFRSLSRYAPHPHAALLFTEFVLSKEGQEILKAGNRVPTSRLDRKSTRLNSSHITISYAVFCLKKKKKHTILNTKTPDKDIKNTPYM